MKKDKVLLNLQNGTAGGRFCPDVSENRMQKYRLLSPEVPAVVNAGCPGQSGDRWPVRLAVRLT